MRQPLARFLPPREARPGARVALDGSSHRMSTRSTVEPSPLQGTEISQLPGLLHGRDDTHAHVEALLDPAALVLSLWVVGWGFDATMGSEYLFLSLGVAMLTYPGRSRVHLHLHRLVASTVLLALTVIGLLIFFGWATRSLDLFPQAVITGWLWAAPATLLGAHLAFRHAAPLVLKRTQRCVIVGMNGQGEALARRIQQNPYTDLVLEGFFDDRDRTRLEGSERHPLLGRLDEVAAYVRRRHVHVIYLSLPMASQDRILRLLDALRDTTASIYFVPDQFITELIQSRASSVVDIPVLAVCETPFMGVNAVLKRLSDVVVCAAALLALSPLLLAIATVVKLTSPGPAIFRQRRYGLDGEEIIVYKFRSMRVAEDGAHIRQASRDDDRVTTVGRILRRTSLDELPQLVNVLQGRMSLVGPRPHAVAHNELYRKLIKGYMVRHKVRPGITGWAQVNGLRGETDTVEKMAARIRHDLHYLRHWSLRLDLYILVKTVAIVLKDKQAY